MADRELKVKEDVMVVQARLVIPPSTCGNLAMSSGDVSETSNIANDRIYAEQAIGRLKAFGFLKNEISISCLPVCDDIVVYVVLFSICWTQYAKLFHKIHKPPTYSNFPKRKKMCIVL